MKKLLILLTIIVVLIVIADVVSFSVFSDASDPGLSDAGGSLAVQEEVRIV